MFALAHPVGLLTLLVQGPSLSVSLALTLCQEPWQLTASSWAHAADALVRTSCCSSLNCHCVCLFFSGPSHSACSGVLCVCVCISSPCRPLDFACSGAFSLCIPCSDTLSGALAVDSIFLGPCCRCFGEDLLLPLTHELSLCVLVFLRPLSLSLLRGLVCVFALAHPVGLFTLLVQGPSLSVPLALTLCQEPCAAASSWAHAAKALLRNSCCLDASRLQRVFFHHACIVQYSLELLQGQETSGT